MINQAYKESVFFGRHLLIATSHKKERVIGPVMKDCFQTTIHLPEKFDTDMFGTFSGEIPREESPVDTARRKCGEAARTANISLVIASEGSFGPHPNLFFVPADEEILVLNDYENDLEIIARVVSTNTNFSGMKISCWQEAEHFAKSIGFPGHKIIVKKDDEDVAHILKDIAGWDELFVVCHQYLERYNGIFLETDMRAMNNPTRMSVIEEAARKLSQLMVSTCPNCKTPGFDVSNAIPGLPCSLCGAPTRSALKHIYSCKKCQFQEELVYPYSRRYEEPMFCDWCNP